MTQRDRKQAKLAKRMDWATKAEARSTVSFTKAHQIADAIPFGQPILSGHHSERHARRDQERIRGNMGKGVAEHKLAQHHAQAASGLADQLERSIFSDDANAIEALEARIAEYEAKAERYATMNAAWRKHKGDVSALVASGLFTRALAETYAETMRQCPWLKSPMETTSLRAHIRTDRERITVIQARQRRSENAEASGGVSIEGGQFVRVTFAEKPERQVIDGLKAAGFAWNGGGWIGYRVRLPEEIDRMAQPENRS